MVGKKSLQLNGNTIAELLENMRSYHEILAETIMAQEGIKPHYRIMLNGLDIFQAQGFQTKVKEGDTIAIFPPIAGGQR